MKIKLVLTLIIIASLALSLNGACPDGYILNQNGDCVKNCDTTNHCVRCDNYNYCSEFMCRECEDGYLPGIDGTCFPVKELVQLLIFCGVLSLGLCACCLKNKIEGRGCSHWGLARWLSGIVEYLRLIFCCPVEKKKEEAMYEHRVTDIYAGGAQHERPAYFSDCCLNIQSNPCCCPLHYIAHFCCFFCVIFRYKRPEQGPEVVYNFNYSAPSQPAAQEQPRKGRWVRKVYAPSEFYFVPDP